MLTASDSETRQKPRFTIRLYSSVSQMSYDDPPCPVYM